jgi:hypothetical protein
VPRVRSHCRFRNRCTDYVRESGMQWMSGGRATIRPSPSSAPRCPRGCAAPSASSAGTYLGGGRAVIPRRRVPRQGFSRWTGWQGWHGRLRSRRAKLKRRELCQIRCEPRYSTPKHAILLRHHLQNGARNNGKNGARESGGAALVGTRRHRSCTCRLARCTSAPAPAQAGNRRVGLLSAALARPYKRAIQNRCTMENATGT